tara:strand:- start:1095 stop:1541 length:447 start_codon:yes stop_codon:yes gene_type:complete
MADSKVSDMTAATSAAGADQLYLVQSSVSKSITAANLFGYINTPAVFNDKLVIGDHDTITAAGVISVDTNVTFINDPSGPGACTIGNGTDGQVKIIIMSSNTGGHDITLGGSNVANGVTFNASGKSATLLYDAGLTKWYFIGGSATVS